MTRRRAKPEHAPPAARREFAIVVLVSANAEWAAEEFSSPERVEPTPYGECFTHAVGNEDVLFFHGGWGKIASSASTEYAINRWRPDVLI